MVKRKKLLSSNTKPAAHPSKRALYSQSHSPLLGKLPLEVRSFIYSYLFSSTKITLGKRFITLYTYTRISSPNALALLKTCRKANDEIADSWIPQVLIHFEDIPTLLDKLSTLPREKLAKLRHMRVASDKVVVFPPPGMIKEPSFTLEIADALRYLPGLHLDTLTVLVSDPPDSALESSLENYDNYLESLRDGGEGWKRLRVVFRGFPTPDYDRDKRLFTKFKLWERLLNKWDESASSVNLYVPVASETSGTFRFGFNPLLEEHKSEGSGGEISIEMPVNVELRPSRLGLHGNCMMLVVERGSKVDCQQRRTQPFSGTAFSFFQVYYPVPQWNLIFEKMCYHYYAEVAVGAWCEWKSDDDPDDHVWSSFHPPDFNNQELDLLDPVMQLGLAYGRFYCLEYL